MTRTGASNAAEARHNSRKARILLINASRASYGRPTLSIRRDLVERLVVLDALRREHGLGRAHRQRPADGTRREGDVDLGAWSDGHDLRCRASHADRHVRAGVPGIE